MLLNHILRKCTCPFSRELKNLWNMKVTIIPIVIGAFGTVNKGLLKGPGGNTPQGTNYTATCLLSQKLYKLDEPDTQDTVGEAKTNSSVMYSYGPPHMAKQKQDDQIEHTYSSYVRIRDVAMKTCKKRWMIAWSGKRGSGISVLAARHDDDDERD